MAKSCARVTLKDVADASGFAVSTVSGVLSGAEKCFASEETRRLILSAAEQLGYEPNPIALALASGQTRILGLVMKNPVELLGNPEGARKFSIMLGAAAERGYQIMTVLLSGVGSSFPTRLVDGCYVWGWVDADAQRKLAEMAKHIPVCVGHAGIPGAIPMRTPESETADICRMAAQHLYGLGHRHVAIVEITNLAERGAAQHFRDVAADMGINVQLDVFVDCWYDRRYPSVEKICALDPLPTVVFAIDDDYARALMTHLLKIGVRVPEDMSVFSREIASSTADGWTAVTGVDLNSQARCREVIRRLIEIINDGGRPSEVRLAPLTLELRDGGTCGAPRPKEQRVGHRMGTAKRTTA